MTYLELLQTADWKEKRKKILIRDKWECQKCFNNSIISNHNVGLFEAENNKIYGTTKRILIDNENSSFGGMVGDYIVPYLSSNLVAYFNEGNGYINIIALRNLCIEELKLIKHKEGVTQRYALKRFEKIQTRNFQDTEEIDNDEKNRKERLKEFILNTNNVYKQLSIKSIENYKWVFSRLDIHHEYYQDGCLPWEYSDDALVALCRICHETHHRNKEIVHLDISGRDIGKLNPCQRCSGLGYLQQYNHIENGICFLCNGNRYIEFIKKPI
jgi:hypothetical protein